MAGTILSFYIVQVPLTDAYRMVDTASVHTIQTSPPIFVDLVSTQTIKSITPNKISLTPGAYCKAGSVWPRQ